MNVNLSAIQAMQSLTTDGSALATTIERLSSGLKINSSADNPAGAADSQVISSRLAGMSQALQNTQNAINMSKTADGGMGAISSLLQDLRTVALQAANGTADASQTQADQTQATSILGSIDSLATSTTWDGLSLLDGTAGTSVQVTDGVDFAGATISGKVGGMQVANGPVTAQQLQRATQSTLVGGASYGSGASTLPAGALVLNGVGFVSDGKSLTVQGLVDQLNAQQGQTGVGAQLVTSGSGVSISLQSVRYGSKFPISLEDPTGILSSPGSSPTQGVDAVVSVAIPVQAANGTPTIVNESFVGGQGADPSGLVLSDGNGNSLQLTSAGNASPAHTGPVVLGTVVSGNISLQLNLNVTGESQLPSLDVRTSQLGANVIPGQNLSKVDVSSQAGAEQAISIIDGAISDLAQSRASLGSYQQSVLQSNRTSLGVASQNLTSSLSQIRDADVATEMTALAREQILQQSGIAVLAQANQQPAQVLQLLK